MIGLLADLTLSVSWWTIKKVAGGVYYIVYGSGESQEEKDLKTIITEIHELKAEVHELKEENIVLISKLKDHEDEDENNEKIMKKNDT